MLRRTRVALVAALLGAATSTVVQAQTNALPYAEFGLDERQAAAFLLDRFTYGALPGQVDAVVTQGLDAWFAAQLAGTADDSALQQRLAGLEALGMDDAQLFQRYPSTSQLRAHMRRFHEGLIPHRDEVVLDFTVVSAATDRFAEAHGFRSQDRDLHEQLLAQKLLRARYSENQLREVMTDFWQNHFHASPMIARARPWLLSYEHTALRARALQGFPALLQAAARHPAMIQYHSAAARPGTLEPSRTAMELTLAAQAADPAVPSAESRALRAAVTGEIAAMEFEEDLILERQFWPGSGPNLEYVRAIVQLQTLGPEAAVTDADLEAAARIFTGWGTLPRGATADWFAGGLTAAQRAGFVVDGSFLFRADRHDAGAKQAFGIDFPAGGGVEEGEALLQHLALHPDTARHIAYKLALRFVDDAPPAALVERLAATFDSTGGDIAAVLGALVQAPEFWDAAAAPAKIKTPLEYAVSALRATQADVDDTAMLAEFVARMGQPLYAYEEPNGYPDNGAYWLDSASLIARLQFAADLAAGHIDGVRVADDALGQASATLQLRQRDEAQQLLASVGAAGTTDTVALLLASPAFQLR